MARFDPNLAEISAPLRELLVKDRDWCWDLSQKESFDSLKELVSSAKCVANLNPKLPTVLSADASSFGIGAVLTQVQPDWQRRPVAYLSRSLTQSEQRYAQIEKEALALTWAAERLECDLKGLDFQFETDHKPLVTLLGKIVGRCAAAKSTKILVEAYAIFLLDCLHTGKQIVTADTFSRAPRIETDFILGELSLEEVSSFVTSCVCEVKLSAHLDKVRLAHEQDCLCQQLLLYGRNGWPRFTGVNSWLRRYWSE